MKKCSKCGKTFADSATMCLMCSLPLESSTSEPVSRLNNSSSESSFEAIKSENHSASYYKYKGGIVETWMYVVTVLCPLIGIIFGSISYAKGENEASKKLIVTSIVASAAVLVLWAIILFACIDF